MNSVADPFTRDGLDDTRNLDISDPGLLAPGETWEQTVVADVPALTFGEVEWNVTASGQGSPRRLSRSSDDPLLVLLARGGGGINLRAS